MIKAITVTVQYISVQFNSISGWMSSKVLKIISFFVKGIKCVPKISFPFVLSYFCRKFKAEGIQIRINLSIALFLAQVVFLSGIDATNNKVWIFLQEKKNHFQNHLAIMHVLNIIYFLISFVFKVEYTSVCIFFSGLIS